MCSDRRGRRSATPSTYPSGYPSRYLAAAVASTRHRACHTAPVTVPTTSSPRHADRSASVPAKAAATRYNPHPVPSTPTSTSRRLEVAISSLLCVGEPPRPSVPTRNDHVTLCRVTNRTQEVLTRYSRLRHTQMTRLRTCGMTGSAGQGMDQFTPRPPDHPPDRPRRHRPVGRTCPVGAPQTRDRKSTRL